MMICQTFKKYNYGGIAYSIPGVQECDAHAATFIINCLAQEGY